MKIVDYSQMKAPPRRFEQPNAAGRSYNRLGGRVIKDYSLEKKAGHNQRVFTGNSLE